MSNELGNPGFETSITTYTGFGPIPTSYGAWTAWRATASRQSSIVASGAWAAKIAAPSGSPAGTFVYQDLIAIVNPYRFNFSFSVYIEDDSDIQEVAVLDGYDHDSTAASNLTRLSLSTSEVGFVVGEINHGFPGITADEWHTILVETNVGMTEQDLTIDGVFVGSATGSTPAFDDGITIGAGHFTGTAPSASTYYFDNFLFERFIDTVGLPANPFIHVEYASGKS